MKSTRTGYVACDYVLFHYKVPACIGRLVTVNGRPGIIYEDRNHYIGVNFDDDEAGNVINVHPKDGVEYFGIGKIREMPKKSKKMYRLYLDCECDETFEEWLENGWYDNYREEG